MIIRMNNYELMKYNLENKTIIEEQSIGEDLFAPKFGLKRRSIFNCFMFFRAKMSLINHP